MAIIKCKMCGGDLNLVEGSTVCECEYCGTKQTVPSADNEKKLTLFGRAGRLLRACEFDKAAGVFETIVADFPQEAEAYWGLVLCKYGIEYVDDPATGKKIPTCHRSSFDSVLDDANFEQACENTDAVARRVYRDEARQIEELRQAILQVSGKEDPYDVFISYKETDENGDRTLDSVIAQDIYKELTDEGYRVFFSRISLEDKLGTEYEPYIFAALNSAKVMLVVGTDYENFDSVWVKNEWSRYLKLIAAGQKKTLIPVFKNMDAYDMPKEFAKLSAQDMGKVGAMQDLVRGVEKIVGRKKTEPAAPVQQPVYVSNETDAKTAAAVKRGRLALEEGNWGLATEYFEQALTLDAECAEAYFGMALAEAECPSAEEFSRRICSQTPEQKTLYIPKAVEHIRDIVKQYRVPHFLDENEIEWHYRLFDLSYTSTAESRKALLEKEKQAFESNRNLSLAYRFAKGAYKETLENYKRELYGTLEATVQKAEREEQETAKEKEDKYNDFLEKADREIEALNIKKQEERENSYQKACLEFEEAKSSHQFKEAKSHFEFLLAYKDSEEYVARCNKKITEVEAEENKERLYATCSKVFGTTIEQTVKNWEEAKNGFESLGDYNDARACAERCAERIEQIKKEEEAKAKAAAEEAERQRILAEKAEKKRKAKKKRMAILAGILVAVAILLFLIVKFVLIPVSYFKSAVKLHESGDSVEAFSVFTTKCPDKAYSYYSRKAADGDTDAMFCIGKLYQKGIGVEQNDTEAVTWYSKAADAGNVIAMGTLGEMYANGNGVTQDAEISMDWFKKAAEADDIQAMRNLGVLYMNMQDYEKAMAWYLKAAEAEDSQAMLYLGVLYEKEQDYEKAMEWYLKAAEAGNSTAMCYLGDNYYAGVGVKQDYEQAMTWLLKAADMGDARAMYNIGTMYGKGQGVTQDYGKAMEWYLKAAEAGYAAAMHNIGSYYKYGYGVTKDEAKAEEWYAKAKAAGYEGKDD